jgi:hypothetical protein
MSTRKMLGLAAIVVILGRMLWLQSRGHDEVTGADPARASPEVSARGDQATSADAAPARVPDLPPVGARTRHEGTELALPDPPAIQPTPASEETGLGTLVVALRTADGRFVPEALVHLGWDGNSLPSPGDAIAPLRTDDRGEVTFTGRCAGPYFLRAEREEGGGGPGRQRDPVPRTGWFIPKKKKGGHGWPRAGILRVEIPEGGTVRREIEVDFTSAVTGVVVDVEGVPVRGATLATSFVAPNYAYGGAQQTFSGPDGRFTLSEIPVPVAGELFVVVTPPGFQRNAAGGREIKLPLDLVPGKVIDLGKIRLEQISGVVKGRLVGIDGSPIPGAVLTLASEDADGDRDALSFSAWTAENGAFDFIGVIGGVFVLACEDHPLVGGDRRVDLPPGTRELDLDDVTADRQAWTLEATFFLGDSAPAAAAEIRIGDEELVADGTGRISRRIDGRRRANLEWRPAGAGAGETIQEWVRPLPPGQNLLEVELRARGIILELRDAANAELLDPALVVVRSVSRDGDGTVTSRHVSPGPRIRLRGPAGEYEVTVQADGRAPATLRVSMSEEMVTSRQETVTVRMEKSR